MNIKLKAFLIVPPIILTIGTVFALLGIGICQWAGIPGRLELGMAVRVGGGVVLGGGFAFLMWVYAYRRPVDILVSTYISFRKTAMRIPLSEPASRTEPLVVTGPQRFVRNPMYFAVVVIFIGWWLVLDWTFILFMAGFFTLWFNLVVIPFEERELRALYGETFAAYVRAVPRFIPSLRPRWP